MNWHHDSTQALASLLQSATKAMMTAYLSAETTCFGDFGNFGNWLILKLDIMLWLEHGLTSLTDTIV